MEERSKRLAAVLFDGDAAASPGAKRLARTLVSAGIRPVRLGPGGAAPPFEADPEASADTPEALAGALCRLGLALETAALVAAGDARSASGRQLALAQVVRLGAAGEGARAGELVVRDAAELAVGKGMLACRTLHSVPDADPETLHRLLENRRPAVFLDYDGVLTPIVADHTRTRLHPPMREALTRLAGVASTAAVSGRDLVDLRRLIGIEGMYYAGSHGFEIAAPDGSVWGERGLEFLPDLDAAEAELRAALASVPGHAVERKRFSCAVHYRNVAESDVPRVAQVVDAVLSSHPRLARGLGKKVFEVQPRIEWNKGRAVLWLIERLDLGPDVLPIYVGDDITDETAFRALAGQGLGIVVRDADPRPTAADLGVADVDGVERLLRFLAGIAQSAGPAR